jgi:RNA polymerase sigma-70 factor (ECF subfamily)
MFKNLKIESMRMTEGMGEEGREVMMHRDLVRKTALKFLGKNYMDWVDDITQDVLLKALLKLHKFDDSKGNMESWLCTMTRNTCFDFMAKKANSLSNVSLDEVSFSLGEEDQTFNSKDLRKKIGYALDRLSEMDRTLLVLRYFFKCSGKEIAKVIGVAENQVAVRMIRAKERMRGIMERECGF